MVFLNPTEYEKMLAAMFYNTRDKQYATKYAMARVWVKGSPEAWERLKARKERIEDEFGMPLIKMQHMAAMSDDLGSFFELDEGRIVTVFELRQELDQFVLDLYDIVNDAKSPFGFD